MCGFFLAFLTRSRAIPFYFSSRPCLDFNCSIYLPFLSYGQPGLPVEPATHSVYNLSCCFWHYSEAEMVLNGGCSSLLKSLITVSLCFWHCSEGEIVLNDGCSSLLKSLITVSLCFWHCSEAEIVLNDECSSLLKSLSIVSCCFWHWKCHSQIYRPGQKFCCTSAQNW